MAQEDGPGIRGAIGVEHERVGRGIPGGGTVAGRRRAGRLAGVGGIGLGGDAGGEAGVELPVDMGNVPDGNEGGVAGSGAGALFEAETAGDRIEVDAMNLVSTKVLTFDNQVMLVPNNQIWNGVITNVTALKTRRVDLTFGIAYDADIARAQAALEELLKAHPKVLAEPAPVIKVSELADSSVNLIVRPWARTEDYWEVYWDMMRQVKERFDAEGIGIPFPQRDVHLYTQGAKEGAAVGAG